MNGFYGGGNNLNCEKGATETELGKSVPERKKSMFGKGLRWERG